MSTTYYVNAGTGLDTNTGTSAAAPLQSIAAVEHLKLQPGDTVLFARGTTYTSELDVKYSGTATNLITVGAYGDGAAPVFSGASTGIHGSKTHDIVIQDLTIAHTSSNAIFALNSSDWTVRNVAVVDSGTLAHSGAISFENGNGITVEGTTITGGTGDGIWVQGGSNIVIEQNHIGTVVGPQADNIQVTGASGVSILNNSLDMSGQTDSTKGNLVVNGSTTVVVDGNTMVGGSYGASVNSNNVTIAHNEVYGQSGYSWSFGIGIGENWNVANYDIHDNHVHDVNYGVAITGSGSAPLMRTNIDVADNTFDNIANAALKVDRPATGDFSGNEVASNSAPTRISPDVGASGTFTLGAHSPNGTFISDAPHANTDTALAGMHTMALHGNVLANDLSLSGGPLAVTEFDGQAISGGFGTDGKYGHVAVDQYGNFVYTVDEAAMSGVTHEVTDVFKYLVADGQHDTYSTLTVDLMPRFNLKPVAVDDGARVDPSGLATGNVLANDHDANHDVLYVRSANTTKVGTDAVHVAGAYGTLTIAADGDYSYQVDQAKVHTGSAVLSDTFSYKISDSSLQDAASLTIHIDVPALTTSPDFHM